MTFPAEEYRLLALFRFWNIINYFYPYKRLMDQPWDSVLVDFIPRVLENKSPLDYETTIAELSTRVPDSHGVVNGLRNLNESLGTFAPPVRLASAGGKVAVTELIDAEAARSAGLRLGDVILEVDAKPISERIQTLAKLRRSQRRNRPTPTSIPPCCEARRTAR
jgi:hypothetical protein